MEVTPQTSVAMNAPQGGLLGVLGGSSQDVGMVSNTRLCPELETHAPIHGLMPGSPCCSDDRQLAVAFVILSAAHVYALPSMDHEDCACCKRHTHSQMHTTTHWLHMRYFVATKHLHGACQPYTQQGKWAMLGLQGLGQGQLSPSTACIHMELDISNDAL